MTRTRFAAAGFEPMVKAFDALGPYPAQLVAYHRGELVLDLTGDDAFGPDALLPIFSSSKGASAVVIALLVERGQLDLDARVTTYWPEFGAAGKGNVLVRQLLSHQAGLLGVDGGFTFEELLAHDPLAERLAAQRPLWRPGMGYGYHAVTIGTLADELVRRIDGRPLAQVLAEDVTRPRDIDVWLGTPEEEDHRVVDVLLPSDDEVAALYATLAAAPTDGWGSMTVPPGGAVALLLQANTVPFRRVGTPAAGGLASARGLARLYACLRHDVAGPRLLSDDTIAQVSQVQATGNDLSSDLPARFAVMFQTPCQPRWTFGSARAFGHDGAGGSLAFADPMYDLAFGYTTQRLPLPGGMDDRAVALTKVLRACVLS